MAFIWTNHATERLNERKIDKSFADQTLYSPDNIRQEGESFKYLKKFDKQTATAIVKKNDQGENIVVSFWLDPPNVGTKDFKSNQRWNDSAKASPIKKFFFTLLNQLGL